MTVLMRALIKRFGGALVVCTGMLACLLAAAPATAAASGCKPPKTAWSFISAPSIHPPRTHVCTHKKSAVTGLVFMGPFHDAFYAPGGLVGQPGALIVDGNGNPVWFHRAPKGFQDSDFQTDTYGATKEPVISFWQGQIAVTHTKLPAGAPIRGEYFVYDEQYHLVAKIHALGKGWITDFHELILTPASASHAKGTAIFFAAKKVAANLRKFGGPAHSAYEDQEIQQIDLATGKLVGKPWNVAKHVALAKSETRPVSNTAVWDPYHANSIDLNSAGDMLVSLRNTWGVYNVDPKTGKFIWQVGGKCVTGTCFRPDKAARFLWQHDARFDGTKKITVFDDGCCYLGVHPGGSGPTHAARGLALSLSKGKATVAHQFHHYNTTVIPTGGNFQTLAGGRAFLGWGQSYYYSEYSKSGSLLYDAAMPKTAMSYRTLSEQWTGMPTTKPSVAVRKPKGKRTAVYASWNGATEVTKWKVLAGSTPVPTKVAGQANRTEFETAIHVSNKGPYYEVQAYHGNTLLGSSGVVKAK